jgi:hypothetical protein
MPGSLFKSLKSGAIMGFFAFVSKAQPRVFSEQAGDLPVEGEAD